MVFENESLMLTQLTNWIGLPVDQLNFLVSEVLALGLAFPFRTYLSVEKVGVTIRHATEITLGVFLSAFCFGCMHNFNFTSQIWHLWAQSLIGYALLAFGGKRFNHALVFGFSMLYLSVCHIYRQIYDYGGYTLDITGPLMIQTQKITSLAFSLHDGKFKAKRTLTADQRDQAVRKLPTILQYLSFMFYFHGIMIGPLTFYKDYIAFIDGTSLVKPGSTYLFFRRRHPMDGLNKIVLRKLVIASAFFAGMMILPRKFYPPEKLNTPEFYSMSFQERMIFVLGIMTMARHKYYFAWILADAVNNAAGLGFTGYDGNGNPCWDLTENVDILGVELATSLKTNIESWNKKTDLWLRHIVYNRTPYFNTLSVLTCSAFWHGFYPGYYITFGSVALLTYAAQEGRRCIRPSFQRNKSTAFTYEVITFIATRLANCYLTFPFLVLEFSACFEMYKSLYFYYHILSLLALMYFVCIKNQNTRPNFTGEFSGSQWQNHQSMDQSTATKSVSVPDIVVRITRPEGIWQPTRVPRMKSAKGTRRHKRRSDSV